VFQVIDSAISIQGVRNVLAMPAQANSGRRNGYKQRHFGDQLHTMKRKGTHIRSKQLHLSEINRAMVDRCGKREQVTGQVYVGRRRRSGSTGWRSNSYRAKFQDRRARQSWDVEANSRLSKLEKIAAESSARGVIRSDGLKAWRIRNRQERCYRGDVEGLNSG